VINLGKAKFSQEGSPVVYPVCIERG